MKTPIQVEDCKGVYSPREDSFLLAKALPEFSGKTILDIGCGTGVQGITALLNGAKKAVFADKNPLALECTKKNLEKLGLRGELVKSDLFENIHEKFDAIIFNPPYVPSEKTVYLDVDGGKNGREVLDRFIEGFPTRLKEKGECFFLQSSLNGLEKTGSLLSKKKISAQIIAREKLFFEELVVFKAGKKKE
ncbi:MAG: methyltransferase [archaeon]|nr:methyltransferase [archaeon]